MGITQGKMTTEPRDEKNSSFGDYDLMLDKAWIGRIFKTRAKSTANEIIRRWNSQPDLLAACKDALEIIAGERIVYDAFPPNDELTKTLEKLVKRCEKKLEAAIKKAK